MDRQQFLLRLRQAPRLPHKDRAILERCAGKAVLDVGCAGQDVQPGDPGWLHGRIRPVAKALDGVDADAASIVRLQEHGFEVHLPHEVAGLGRTWDVVVMADVIEHVDDPVSFLAVYAAYLSSPESVILVTTPNPFAARQFLHVLASGSVSVNPEHTMWLDPLTLFEVAARAGLEIRETFWLGYYYEVGALPFGERLLHRAAAVLARLRRYYSPNFMCVLGKPS